MTTYYLWITHFDNPRGDKHLVHATSLKFEGEKAVLVNRANGETMVIDANKILEIKKELFHID